MAWSAFSASEFNRAGFIFKNEKDGVNSGIEKRSLKKRENIFYVCLKAKQLKW